MPCDLGLDDTLEFSSYEDTQSRYASSAEVRIKAISGWPSVHGRNSLYDSISAPVLLRLDRFSHSIITRCM